MRIGRMRGFAEGDRAVNDCLAAIHPHPSRRLCCYAKWKCSAIRQPPLIGSLNAQASRHLPHKGEGFRIAKPFCPTLGARSRAATLLSLARQPLIRAIRKANCPPSPRGRRLSWSYAFVPLGGGSFDYFATQNFASRTAQDDSRRQRAHTWVRPYVIPNT